MLHHSQLTTPHIPKISAGRFATNVPITEWRLAGNCRWKHLGFPRRLQSVWHGGRFGGQRPASRVHPLLSPKPAKIRAILLHRIQFGGKPFRLCGPLATIGLDVRTIVRLQTTGLPPRAAWRRNLRGVLVGRANSCCRLAKNTVTGTEKIGGRSAALKRSLEACGRPLARQAR